MAGAWRPGNTRQLHDRLQIQNNDNKNVPPKRVQFVSGCQLVGQSSEPSSCSGEEICGHVCICPTVTWTESSRQSHRELLGWFSIEFNWKLEPLLIIGSFSLFCTLFCKCAVLPFWAPTYNWLSVCMCKNGHNAETSDVIKVSCKDYFGRGGVTYLGHPFVCQWGTSEGLFSLNGVALHHLIYFIWYFFLRINVSVITLFAGVYAGIKFFIIDFLFKSCPKLRDKYDTPYIVWNSLPTDPQLKERTNATVSRRVRQTDPSSHTRFLPPTLLPVSGSWFILF